MKKKGTKNFQFHLANEIRRVGSIEILNELHLNMQIPLIIQQHFSSLYTLSQRHKVYELYVFGSVATGNFDALESDIDFLVSINEDDPVEKGTLLISLWNNLESIFGRRVDLLTPEGVKNIFLKQEIDRTKLLIYDAKRKEVSAGHFASN